MASAANGGGTKIIEALAGRGARLGDRVEHRNALDHLAALARRLTPATSCVP